MYAAFFHKKVVFTKPKCWASRDGPPDYWYIWLCTDRCVFLCLHRFSQLSQWVRVFGSSDCDRSGFRGGGTIVWWCPYPSAQYNNDRFHGGVDGTHPETEDQIQVHLVHTVMHRCLHGKNISLGSPGGGHCRLIVKGIQPTHECTSLPVVSILSVQICLPNLPQTLPGLKD